MLAGQVIAAYGRHYLVETGNGRQYACFPRGKRSTVACGDRVMFARTADEQGVIEAARRSHPFVGEDGASRTSDSYRCGDVAPGPFGGTLPRPPAGAEELAFAGRTVGWLRQLVSEWALGLGLGYERTEQLVLAVTELASNSVHHGGGAGTLWMWREQGTLLVEVHDRGHIAEPLIGRTRPGPEQLTGRGLWVVNHLCDLVQIRSAPTGNVVRVHMRLG